MAAASVFAQNADVDYVCSILSAHKMIEGNFVQEKKAPQAKRALKSSGTFIFCDEGIYLATIKPVSSAIGVTPNSLINISSDGKRTVTDNSSNATFQGIANIITAIFNGDKSQLEENFKTQIDGTTSNWNMVLTPLDATVASTIRQIVLTGNTEFTGLTLENASGGTIAYTFTDQYTHETVSNEIKKLFTSN
ncbi:MAG: outer membrane lipoprotein carrier protein LolA [Treponemataceae bacterium]|nr:outer membrane lipoprotein carrier protein LolA [Treponemataceae bacterium]